MISSVDWTWLREAPVISKICQQKLAKLNLFLFKEENKWENKNNSQKVQDKFKNCMIDIIRMIDRRRKTENRAEKYLKL